jgi:hypothetical protein
LDADERPTGIVIAAGIDAAVPIIALVGGAGGPTIRIIALIACAGAGRT